MAFLVLVSDISCFFFFSCCLCVSFSRIHRLPFVRILIRSRFFFIVERVWANAWLPLEIRTPVARFDYSKISFSFSADFDFVACASVCSVCLLYVRYASRIRCDRHENPVFLMEQQQNELMYTISTLTLFVVVSFACGPSFNTHTCARDAKYTFKLYGTINAHCESL